MLQNLSLEIQSWKVSHEVTFSDHKYIEFEVNVRDPEPTLSFRNPRRINWEIFIGKISNSLLLTTHEIRNPKDIENFTSNLEKCFAEAFKESCPCSTNQSTKNKEWWHKDLEKLRTSTKRALNAVRHFNTEYKWEQYKNKRKEFKKQIRKAKRQCFIDKLKEIETIKDTSRLRKMMSKQKNVPGNIKRSNGTWTESAKETLEALFETHFPGCNLNTKIFSRESLCHETTTSDMDYGLVTVEKIKWAISTFVPYKSPGLDGIYPIMLQKCSEMIYSFLTSILHQCHSLLMNMHI